ncbi:hypothetical protein PHISCL_11214 [Aspergillus sclerotialis]|nr:hypothetical protein PHISCL_11214 [Aspergillus sclerotialis]
MEDEKQDSLSVTEMEETAALVAWIRHDLDRPPQHAWPAKETPSDQDECETLGTRADKAVFTVQGLLC